LEELIYYIKSADVYLGSFPFHSSTATIEVLLEEIPSVICKSEEKVWDVIRNISVELDDVVEKIKYYLINGKIDTKILTQINEIHCEQNWKKRLNQIFSNLPNKHF